MKGAAAEAPSEQQVVRQVADVLQVARSETGRKEDDEVHERWGANIRSKDG